MKATVGSVNSIGGRITRHTEIGLDRRSARPARESARRTHPLVAPQMLPTFRCSSRVQSRAQLLWPADQWYDTGMTTAKIAISLPKHLLAGVRREVRSGRADSVSGYIANVLAEQEKRDSLRTLLRDLIEQHGEPAPEDIKWAERMLPRRGRG